MTTNPITGKRGETFSGSYSNGVKGHRLIDIQDGNDWGGGFFNPDQLREIAALCIQLAEEAENDQN